MSTAPHPGPQMATRSTFMSHFDFVTGRQKPENMEGRRSLLLILILILAACFYGNTAQRTGGCDYVAGTLLPAYQRATEPPFIITSLPAAKFNKL